MFMRISIGNLIITGGIRLMKEYCQVLFIFFFSGRLCTDIVLFLIFRIGLIKSAVLSSGLSTGHLPIASEGTSYKMAMPVPFRISPCLSRPEIRRTSVSAIWPCSLFLYGHNIYPFFCHIFFIFISFRMVFSLFLGKGSAREIPFFSLKNNKEEQAGVSVFAILSCRPFFILIFLLCIKMKHYGFSRKGGWKDNDGMFLHHRNTHRQGVLTVNERRREKRIKTNAEVRSL